MDGIDFINNFIAATGLPSELVRKELSSLAELNGKKIEQLTLEDMRVLLVDYLQDALLSAHQEHSLDADAVK